MKETEMASLAQSCPARGTAAPAGGGQIIFT
jgi:hypothetical protein